MLNTVIRTNGDLAMNKCFGMCQDPKINDVPFPLLPPPLWVCPTAPDPWPCTHTYNPKTACHSGSEMP